MAASAGCAGIPSWRTWSRVGSSGMLAGTIGYRNSSHLRLHLARIGGRNAFTAYGSGYVAVNGVRYERSIIVLPERIITDWPVATFEALRVDDFAMLSGLRSDIILLGTGDTLRFPRPELVRPLVDAAVGLEVMDVHAACRTYNILMDEQRKVAAALLLG